MIKSILTMLGIGTFLSLHAQALKEDRELYVYNNEPIIQALRSITLKDGFTVPKGSIVTISIGGLQNLVSKPTVGQNYILTKNFRKYGVTLENLNVARTIGEENQTIQYIDGLGRPSQIVQLMASPTYKDIVQYIEYDGFGRESMKYLPYAHSEGNGSYKTGGKGSVVNFYDKSTGYDIAGIVRTDKPYAVTVFENSPLNRVTEQGAPGVAWQPVEGSGGGHTVKSVHGTNTAAEVKLWQVTYDAVSGMSNGATGTKKYASGKLYKTIVKDENWVSGKGGTVEEFKDFEDRVVLKRVWKGEVAADALDTYYVYDHFGSLCYVIPPALSAATSFTESIPDFLNYIYAYHYDSRRRLVEKKIPGKGWEHMVYNKNDQLVQVQDAIQRTNNKWTVTKYDAFGRVVMTGIHQGSHARDVEQEHLMTVETVLWENRLPGQGKYANVSYPQNNFTPLTINYYDDYSFSGNDIPALKADNIKPSSKLKGLLTGQVVYQDDGTNPLLTIFYYDDYGRIIQSVAQNQLNAGKGTDVVTNTYSFTGELETSKRVHSSGVEPATIILTTNLYDHAGRLLETKKRINTQNEITQSKLAYNEIGQLKQKDLHVNGSTIAQQIVYGYNERGWLSKINNADAVNAKQVFGMELSYADKADTYNGNIGTMKWNTKVTASMTLQPVQTYTYSYDKLNRLSRGSYINAGAAAVNKSGFYDEELRYDNMGNIDSLRRTNGSKTWSNNFKYTYSGHKLSKVTDAVTSSRTNSFAYDVNGNATTNTRLGITKIAYNYLNLPVKFTKGPENLVYKYNALGQKLTKELGATKTDYVNGIQYKNGTIDFIQTEEGRILPSNGSYIYEYFLEDHLGNTRAVVDHSGTIKQIQDYYPFGLEMNQGNSLNTASNLYKYNGKEKQVEMGLDQFDYGARFYDAEIGRWNVVDPKAEKYFSHSPYNYALNNSIKYIDPDGKDIILWMYKRNNGNYSAKQVNFNQLAEKEQRLLYQLSMNKDGNSLLSNFVNGEVKWADISIKGNSKEDLNIFFSSGKDVINPDGSLDHVNGQVSESNLNGKKTVEVDVANQNEEASAITLGHEMFLHLKEYTDNPEGKGTTAHEDHKGWDKNSTKNSKVFNRYIEYLRGWYGDSKIFNNTENEKRKSNHNTVNSGN